MEVVSSYIKLQKAGANYRALCPFHSEKTPSFFVSPARQIWHCFGSCSEGGDVFKFVMKIEGIEFGDALRMLARKAGVELKPISPKLRTERQRLYEICQWTCQFFEKQLAASKIGQEVTKYLLKRGIKEESIKKYRVGYSPDTWQGLSDFLVGRGYRREEVAKAGLAIQKEQGNFYDRFRGRIMFPIFDLNSQVIGFGGRIFKSEDTAKYVNTPSTLLYDKSRILYGLDKAKVEIRKKGFAILVEGYTDVIMLSQADHNNVVATSGTALTPLQLKILKRYSDNLLTAFDMDIAGNSATKRGIDLAQTQGFNIKVITMPEGKDPADIMAKNPKKWEKLVEEAKSILQFYFATALSRADPKTPEGKKEIGKILLPVLKRIPNKIEQAHWLQELAKILRVREEDIREELSKTKPSFHYYASVRSNKESVVKHRGRKELLEERLATLVLKSPKELDLISKEDFDLFSPQIGQVLNHCKDPGAKANLDLFNCLSLKAEIEEIEEKDLVPEIRNCLKEIRTLSIKNKLDQISQDIRKAEEEKNLSKAQKLVQEFHQLSQKLLE